MCSIVNQNENCDHNVLNSMNIREESRMQTSQCLNVTLHVVHFLVSVISGFRRSLHEIFVLVGCYTA